MTKRKIKRRTPEEAKDELKELGWELLTEWKGTNKKITCKCISCGYERYNLAKGFFKSPDCPVCAGRRHTMETFTKKLIECNDKLEIIPGQEFKTVDDRYWFRCRAKGHKVFVKGINALHGSGCKVCFDEWNVQRLKEMSGEKHPFWNPNISDEERELWKKQRRGSESYEYGKWRRVVFERDDYTCAYCGQRGGKLEAHHLEGWKVNKELRYDINNGVTLCVSCHRTGDHAFHKIYGKGNNTKAQFLEWIATKEADCYGKKKEA